jgi:hypothetical protein
VAQWQGTQRGWQMKNGGIGREESKGLMSQLSELDLQIEILILERR